MECSYKIPQADGLPLLEDERLHLVVLEVRHEALHVPVVDAADQLVREPPADELWGRTDVL